MFQIPGIDDEETLAQLLGTTPLDEAPQGFQAQQAQTPDLAQLLNANGVAQQMQDMTGGSDIAALMAQTAQQIPAGNGSNRIAQQQQANQAAMQQSQQKGGGLLSSLLKIGANIAMNNWIGGMFPKKTGA